MGAGPNPNNPYCRTEDSRALVEDIKIIPLTNGGAEISGTVFVYGGTEDELYEFTGRTGSTSVDGRTLAIWRQAFDNNEPRLRHFLRCHLKTLIAYKYPGEVPFQKEIGIGYIHGNLPSQGRSDDICTNLSTNTQSEYEVDINSQKPEFFDQTKEILRHADACKKIEWAICYGLNTIEDIAEETHLSPVTVDAYMKGNYPQKPKSKRRNVCNKR